MNLWKRFQLWRLRPGIEFASAYANQCAYRWPQQGQSALVTLTHFRDLLDERLDRAEHGDCRGLYLDATKTIAEVRDKR